ncbi:CopD family protein [Aurantiacibacter sp. MUD11]|uniref:CopD family protein n=1 Tax=Aurantiacibacter sp. MUD11 TaxID=3003265 RepID=UPI0022AA5A89|nr:CopD family protein [Aurantiacibacter sp. MUD11]WAT17193.1 CopD family protein [Aurantiacibacter sp. MUD11]
MQEALAMTYLWLKAGHIIFMTFWMAGLFMLPRQMIYMHGTAPGSPEEAAWARRSGLLRKIILSPSLIVVWVLGLMMAWSRDLWLVVWFDLKLLAVIALTGFHGWLVGKSRAMAAGERPLTEKQLRAWGEFPGVALAVIVILVVVGQVALPGRW